MGTDHILTNHTKLLQNSGTFKTRLSDFHTLTYIVLKIHYAKQKPRVVRHRGYQNFTNVNSGEMYQKSFLINFQKDEVTKFKYLTFKPLNNLAPLKEKL